MESQIFGRRIQEPNVAVMHCKHQPNPKHHSPESFLDQFVNLKLVEPQKILQKQKQPQGLQGKGILNNVQYIKPAQSSISVKKQTKRTISPKKKKAQTVDCVQMNKPKSQQQRREQLGLGELNEKQIKQRIKKIKQKEKIVEQHPLKKKPYEPNIRLQNYITQKKTIINNNYIQQQLLVEMEKQRKQRNAINKIGEFSLVIAKFQIIFIILTYYSNLNNKNIVFSKINTVFILFCQISSIICNQDQHFQCFSIICSKFIINLITS